MPDQLFDATAQPIQFPDDERVAFPNHIQCFGESRTFGAADLVFADPLAAGLRQSLDLKVQILILR